MIEVIEKALFSRRLFFKGYKKAWVIILQDLGETSYKVITLITKTTFLLPVSKKRWRLERRFLREGCNALMFSSITLLSNEGRKKYWLSSGEIIRVGNITDKILIEELKRADSKKKS